MAKSQVVAGIHLSGPNARKSAVVLLEIKDKVIRFLSVYEKIGSSCTLFSDDRILNILAREPTLASVFVDCPISEPPCVTCQRDVCPGVVRCDDVSVALMLAMEDQRSRAGARKLRPFNPQNQRLWDVVQANTTRKPLIEPTYSANLAPLVVRAKTLHRRLRSLSPTLKFMETNVPLLLSQLQVIFGTKDWSTKYRSFELGLRKRHEIVSGLTGSPQKPLSIRVVQHDVDTVSQSVETFHAFLAAAMAAWEMSGIAQKPTQAFRDTSGWVQLLDPVAVSQLDGQS